MIQLHVDYKNLIFLSDDYLVAEVVGDQGEYDLNSIPEGTEVMAFDRDDADSLMVGVLVKEVTDGSWIFRFGVKYLKRRKIRRDDSN